MWWMPKEMILNAGEFLFILNFNKTIVLFALTRADNLNAPLTLNPEFSKWFPWNSHNQSISPWIWGFKKVPMISTISSMVGFSLQDFLFFRFSTISLPFKSIISIYETQRSSKNESSILLQFFFLQISNHAFINRKLCKQCFQLETIANLMWDTNAAYNYASYSVVNICMIFFS